mmetsp:Transcript_14447/g.41107  ORF Transcript_14447/g.41107 Transcript_14447/m.41107 type:complete len:236 (+) Transcript_14447:36-743(+)
MNYLGPGSRSEDGGALDLQVEHHAHEILVLRVFCCNLQLVVSLRQRSRATHAQRERERERVRLELLTWGGRGAGVVVTYREGERGELLLCVHGEGPVRRTRLQSVAEVVLLLVHGNPVEQNSEIELTALDEPPNLSVDEHVDLLPCPGRVRDHRGVHDSRLPLPIAVLPLRGLSLRGHQEAQSEHEHASPRLRHTRHVAHPSSSVPFRALPRPFVRLSSLSLWGLLRAKLVRGLS